MNASGRNLVSSRSEAASGPRNTRLSPAGRSSLSPLSFAQECLWFLDQLEPNSPLYNMLCAARLTGTLNRSALEQALAAMVARHETLRTRFGRSDGEPFQIIDEETRLQIPFVDLAGCIEAERETELQRLIQAEANRPFNLEIDSLLHVVLVRLGPKEHVLSINMHHIISDEWSFRIFFHELAVLYADFAGGRPSSLPELPIQYRDYACWQRDWLQGEVLASQLRYWREQLGDNPLATELSTDRPRSPHSNCPGAGVWRVLKTEISAGLKNLAQQERASLFMVLLAGFNVLLHRYTEQEDILIGSPTAGRNWLEVEGLIGFFINTLPLRNRISGDQSFLQLLAQVRRTTLDAYSHQDLPFKKLVAELQPERSPNLPPFVRIIFMTQSGTAGPPTWPGLKVEFIDSGPCRAKFDLLLSVNETPEGLMAVAHYNSDLFDADTMARLLEHYENLLAGIVADPTQHVSELPFLSESERHQLLVEWNRTRTEYPRNQCVPELFEEQVRQRPGENAVVFDQSRLTYGELNTRANQLAHHLQKAGVKPGMRVGICAERSLEMLVGLLGILKAGAAYAPLEPGLPAERLRGMLEDLQVPVLLTQHRLLAPLAEIIPQSLAVPPVCLDTDWMEISRESPENPCCEVMPEMVAYISFTSGSTGRPKGVCVPHRGIVRLVKNNMFASFSPLEVFLQFGPISFDASLFEIWGVLLNGGELVIAPPGLPSLSDLAEIIRNHHVTTVWLTAGLFNQVIDELPEALKPLRQILTGGDVLSPPHVKKALDLLPHCRLVNGYGPTENTTFTATYQIPPVFDGQTPVPIGRPIANTECYILDGHLRPVPIGVPGELYAGGDGLAVGYLNRPELTSERFIPNPHKPGTLLYKTGDRARYRTDGNIEFLERSDQQVKIRGFRVEPGEVETKLLQHPDVRQCAVVARLDAVGTKQLVAYVVPVRQSASAASEYRQFLHEHLPGYMVPAHFVTLDELPLSPNGKVNRRALPAPELTREPAQAAGPMDEVEQQLQHLWEAALNVHPIGIRDKFFALGGHSLLAVRLVARVEKVFGKKLPVAAVFENPTIEQMAHVLREGADHQRHSSIVEIQPSGSRPPLLLVHGAGGGMFWGYNNLAHHLGADQPVFAFNSRGLEGLEELETIEALAESYLADLMAFQPRGPYYLGGYCFGGIIAYEMAHRLQAQGKPVALVALINSIPPNSSYVKFHWTPASTLRFAWNFCVKAYYSRPSSAERWARLLRWKAALLARRLQQPATLFSASDESMPVDADQYQDLSEYSNDERRLWQAHIRALTLYRPPVSPLRITLFRSPLHLLYSSFDFKYGWGELARGGVTVKVVPGAHDTIMEESRVGNLAEAFKMELENCQTPAG